MILGFRRLGALTCACACLAWSARSWAQAADVITALALIDADSDAAVAEFTPLPQGAVIPLEAGARFNIEALTDLATTDGVQFEFRRDGAVVREHFESRPPYALFGNAGGDYFPWIGGPETGVVYTVRAWLVGLSIGPAAPGQPLEVSFSFSPVQAAVPPIISLTLINADTDAVVAGFDVLTDGSILDLSTLPRLAVRANAHHDLRGSIRFELLADGQVIRIQIEDSAPYALFGNSGSDYAPWPGGGPQPGRHYEITAVPYELDGARGGAGEALPVGFDAVDGTASGGCAGDAECDDGLFCNGSETCGATGDCQAGTPPCGSTGCDEVSQDCGPPAPQCSAHAACDDGLFCNGPEWCDAGGTCRTGAAPCPRTAPCSESSDACVQDSMVVSHVRLIDADRNQVLTPFDPLVDGDLLNIDDLPRLNFEALTQPAQVGWVELELRRAGEPIQRRTEMGAPYALFGNSGSDFLPWTTAQPGYNYELSAVPFSAAGDAGAGLTVRFSLTDDGQAPIADASRTHTLFEDQDGDGAETVTLDGSGSRGVAAGLTLWEWYDLANPAEPVLLGSGEIFSLELEPGTHDLELIVQDAGGRRSAGDELQVMVLPNTRRDLGQLGSFSRWHKVEIDFPGPMASASGHPNPFDIQMHVTFSGPGGTHVVPAYYDGDGHGGSEGSVWTVRFSPPADGGWSFSSTADEPALDGFSGTFSVTSPPPSAPALLRHGPLRYADGPYLRQAGGPFWIKSGMDDPENLLGQAIGDWNAKQEVIDYISARGVNSVYVITNNIDGDRRDTWPWLGNTQAAVKSGDNSQRFDVARLAQWEDFFTYCESRDVVLHIVLDDDEAWTGYDHDRYYREMVARFAHHLGLIWNLGEEADEIYSDDQQVNLATRLRELDPYDHPITVHRWVQQNDMLWPFIADPGAGFDLASIQAGVGGGHFSTSSLLDLNAIVRHHQEASTGAGRPLPVMIDEFPGIDVVDSTNRFNLRQKVIWAVLLGGGNLELHYRDAWSGTGNLTPYSLGPMWEDLGRARALLEQLPFETMRPANVLLSGTSGTRYCLARPGVAYAIYLAGLQDAQLDLRGVSGSYNVTWYDAGSGQTSAGPALQGGSWQSLGTPPFSGDVAVTVVSSTWLALQQDSDVDR